MSDNKQSMSIAVRSYIFKKDINNFNSNTTKKLYKKRNISPSEWTIIFDTETTTDAAQQLRFGTYQVRKDKELIERGVFYDNQILKETEIETLKNYAEKQDLKVLTVEKFIEDIFYGVGYDYRATIVGFNLPFDISRLAIGHTTARASKRNKLMQGGFTFKLSERWWRPRVQIKHVSSKNSFIQFAGTKGQHLTKGDRKKGRWKPIRRGYFIDVKTLAAALTSQSHSLASLGQFLGVEAQKYNTEEHGCELTQDYIKYAVQDTQATWECYNCLQELYKTHNLKQTPAYKIHSEASLGKAYLKDMGINTWRKLQPDFPPEIIGHIMSTYYGGRSEVHIRKEITQVLYCDFLSMYPTVCTLMGLWNFVIAQGIEQEDSTNKTQEFLEKINICDLQKQETWQSLTTIVQVSPDNDIFPVRAKYGGDAQYTISLNRLTSKMPVWYTLADCIASKILTGKIPKIIKAISFIVL